MKCEDALRLLHPFSDGELDLVRQLEMEDHLKECATCAEQEKRLQSIRAAVSSPSLYHRAPPTLRQRLQSSVASAADKRRSSPRQLVAIAASALFLVGTSMSIGMRLSSVASSSEDRIAENVLVGHVRSLQVEHAIDVASSDRHTVKPWFHGKLDFSPAVPDLSAQGFSLSGGRLDYLSDRPVAALVYYRRLHAINVFTWPALSDKETTVHAFSRQGFHLREWQNRGMNYWAISDLNDQELDEFVQVFRGESTTQPR